jgi:hypothetical protein
VYRTERLKKRPRSSKRVVEPLIIVIIIIIIIIKIKIKIQRAVSGKFLTFTSE